MIHSGNPDWFYLKSLIDASQFRWSSALNLINSALHTHPSDIQYLLQKAIVSYNLDLRIEALVIFKRILRIAPWSIKARAYSGIILFESGQFREALPHFQIVRNLAPEDPWSYYNLYRCLIAVPGHKNEAEEILSSMLEKFDDRSLPVEILNNIPAKARNDS